MPRMFKLVSVAIHAVAIVFVFVAQVWTVGPLPTPPRDRLTIEQFPAKIIDIPLPPPRRTVTSEDHTLSAPIAPVTAPEGVRPETGNEGLRSAHVDPSLLGSVDGVGEPGNVIVGDSVPPPPPPPPAPQKPIHLHRGIQAPRKIVDVQPLYPEIARRVRQQGVVILETVIDATGAVERVRVLRGYPFLDQAAIDAVRQWRFTPALLNGQPVPVVMTVTVNFVLEPIR
jgi:protein TonB